MRRIYFGIYIVIIFLLFVNESKAQDTLAYWGLNEAAGAVTKEAISNTNFTIQSKWPVIEKVPGIRQQGLRTDGYTVFTEGSANTIFPQDSFSVSAWLALETFPVSTAAVWSNVDPVTDRGASVAIDKFGKLVVRFTVGAQVVTFTSSSSSLQHYQWSYIVVNVNAATGNVTGYSNADKIIDQSFSPGSLSWSSAKTYLGRSSSNEKQDIFPLNYLNGIVDEIVVRKKLLSLAEITAVYNLLKPSAAPNLSIPDSRFAFDFHRPKYHPAPQSAWANESHGLIFHNGVYHMFYQKNGNGPFFSQQNWGHLISTDLVSWKETQVALWPQAGGFETVGIWSGHLINNNDVPTIFYTAVDGIKAGIGSATSDNNLLNWQRNVLNPQIPSAPSSYPNKDFRDPYVFKEGSDWYMIIGSGLQSPQSGTVFLYKSNDLNTWQLIGPMFVDQSFLNDPGVFWEMPVFWKFGNKYMLLVNKVPVPGTPARAFYWMGEFDGSKFTPSNPRSQNLEIINSLLSPAVNVDEQNRVTAIGIIPDLLPGSEQYENGWANIFSLPRVWQMINDTLHQSPHPNLERARGAVTTLSNISIQPNGSNYLNVRGWQLELKATINPGTATQTGFILGQNDNKTEFTKIWYDYQNQKMIVDRTKSSNNSNTPRDIQSESFPLPAGQPVEWHLFIDGSVIEVFINNRWAFAARIYPVDNTSNRVDLFSVGGNATASIIQVWNRGNLVTGIFDPPVEYKTTKAWPVPATDNCFIELPANITGNAELLFYDMTGRLIRQIQQKITPSLKYIKWDLCNTNGVKVSAGNYFCVLSVNNTSLYRPKLLVTKK